MSADAAFCRKQIRRCTGLDFFPAGDGPEHSAAVAELIGTLARRARDNEHARRMIDAWLERHKERPTPADIVDLARQIPAGEGLPAGCLRCNGEPWVIAVANGGTAAARCTCARGAGLRAADAARERPGGR